MMTFLLWITNEKLIELPARKAIQIVDYWINRLPTQPDIMRALIDGILVNKTQPLYPQVRSMSTVKIPGIEESLLTTVLSYGLLTFFVIHNHLTDWTLSHIKYNTPLVFKLLY